MLIILSIYFGFYQPLACLLLLLDGHHHQKSVRKPADFFVNLSPIDYELVCNILRLLDETGIDEEELSFLLGKRIGHSELDITGRSFPVLHMELPRITDFIRHRNTAVWRDSSPALRWRKVLPSSTAIILVIVLSKRKPRNGEDLDVGWPRFVTSDLLNGWWG